MLKRFLGQVSIFSAALMLAFNAQAELKVGWYNNRVILENLPMVSSAEKKLAAEFEPTIKEITDKREALIKLQEDITKNGEIMSEAERKKKSLDYQSKRRELQLQGEDYERLRNLRQNEAIRSIQIQVSQEVEKIAKEEGYDLILHSGVLYAGPKVDITQKVLQRLAEK